MPRCILEDKECLECGDCDRCDLDHSKRCDNCCSCIDGHTDYVAIKIDGVLDESEDFIDNQSNRHITS